MPLAATLATERIYEAFLGSYSEFKTFFHGHTYTGNPLACAAALASLEVFRRERTLVRLQPKIRLLSESLAEVEEMNEVSEVRQCGLMVGIDLGEHDPELRLGNRVALEARKRGVIVRPLGDVIVLMPPLAISKQDLRRLVDVVAESIGAAYPVAELDPGARGRRRRPARGRLGLLLVGLEVGLAGPADRAEPVVGNVLEGGARRYPAVGVALVGVVDESARGADVELLGGGVRRHRAPICEYAPTAWSLAHGGEGERSAGGGRRPASREGRTARRPGPAATVILLRRGGKHAQRGLELLLVQRNPEARFMPGVWVFPGGAVDPADGDGEAAHRAAAVRELAEEAGIRVDADDLVAYSRWITPRVVPVRFDTRFYLALAPAHSPPKPDGSETVDAGWFEPRRRSTYTTPISFPSSSRRSNISNPSSASRAPRRRSKTARRREVKPVEPEVVGEGDERRIVLPDELP